MAIVPFIPGKPMNASSFTPGMLLKLVALFLAVGTVAAALPMPRPNSELHSTRIQIPLSEQHLELFFFR